MTEQTPQSDAGRWNRDSVDPRGLIREGFAIEGIHEADCRSIFFDWALGLDPGLEPAQAIEILLEGYADQPADHPMRQVLLEGLNRRDGTTAPVRIGRRRGGRRSRVSES